MLIKSQALLAHLKKGFAPLYVLIGQDSYLLEESLRTLKLTIQTASDCDHKKFIIQSPEDWNLMIEEANCYSLFSEMTLITVLFDKKTIDATGKKVLTAYLQSLNPRTYLILCAPQVAAKQIQWLSALQEVTVVLAYPMNQEAINSWVGAQLKGKGYTYEPQVPELIQQYTQGNMLACAQAIEKIGLSQESGDKITVQLALSHLSDQSDHSLYDLIEACLTGQSGKAIQILRHAANSKAEPTLVLWMLTQEIRLFTQLQQLIQQQVDFSSACSQLKIWPQRVSLYQRSGKRFNQSILNQLIHFCHLIDERIKSNLNTYVWNDLECLAMSLCLGKLVGEACLA